MPDAAGNVRDRRYRAIFESAVDFAIIATDRDGKVTDWNTGAEHILGWAAEEMGGEPLDRIFTPEDRADGVLAAEMRCALETGRAGDDRWHLRKDGSRLWASGEMTPLRGEDDAHLGYLKILRDRTEQRRSAEALRRSEENLRFALDAGQLVGAWNWDLANDRVYADARFARLFGVNPDRAASGAPVAEFMAGMHPEDRDRVGLTIQWALEEAGEFVSEYRLIQEDGSIRWVLARGRAYHDEAGTPVRFPGIVVDITERKRVEEALRVSEERLRIAQRAGRVGTFEWHPDAGKIDGSDEYRRIWGVAPGMELTADFLIGLLHPDDRTLAGPARLRSDGNPLEYAEYRFTRPDTGEERWIARRGEVVPAGDGAPRRFVGVAFDITERKVAEAALRERGNQLRLLIEAAPASIAMFDREMRYLAASRRFVDDYRLDGQDMIGRSHYDVFPEMPARWKEIHRRCLAGAVERSEADPFLRADGRTNWLRWEIHPWRDGAGEIGGIVLFSEDITDRIEAEAALRLQAEEFQALADNIPTLCWMAYADGHIYWYNRRWYEYTGTDPESQEGWGWESVHDPEVLPQVVERWRYSLATGEPFEMIFPLRGGDGVFRPFLTRIVPIRGAGGRIMRWFGTNTDITEQREAEQALRESEARFRGTFDQAAVGVAHVGLDGRWLRVNARLCAMLGYTEAELLQRTFQDITHPDDLQADLGNVRSLLAGEIATYSMEKHYVCKDGALLWVNLTVSLLHDAAGVPQHFISVVEDISARKAAEAALQALNLSLEAKVEERTRELMQTEEQLRQSQKMEAVGQLTGGLAHDFNNLLTGIAGSLELLQARIAQGRVSDVDRYVTAAQGAAKRAAILTHRLLAFSRRQTLDPKSTNVNRLIAGMEDLIRRTVGPAVEIEVIGTAGLWTTLVDPNQLENALLNLCINARDAMPDGGRLTIETENKWLDGRTGRERDLAPGQYVSLCVTDTGTGMTPDVIERAFDPFFTTKPLGLGTGLGLSMVYGFARQSGGQVRIYSELGRGTTMCLYLPRHHGLESSADAAPEPAGVPVAEQGRTVLVVDDEPTVRMLVAEVLEDLGYAAIEAADGAAGLQVLQSDIRLDLLITDVGLPGGMNGRQVADAGRAVRPGLRVLFITGYAENAVVGNGHLEPGMQVLTKPFAMGDLASRIRDLIAGT